MIQVNLPPPPSNYESEVKQPGEAFLRNNTIPTNRDWNNHRYWSKIHDYLYNEHKGICLYCASWSPRRSNPRAIDIHTSVDHFKPKTLYKNLAYEWSNYRLCRSRLNSYKSDFQDVLDPCLISNDWFYLDFATFLIKPSLHITDSNLRQQVKDTINRLRINSDNDYVEERIRAIKQYSFGNLNPKTLNEKYPFIAYQIRIQNFDKNYRDRIIHFFQSLNIH